jgi:hypothetical protein
MHIKKVIITLENEEGNNPQVVMHIPADIVDGLNDAPMFRSLVDDVFELVGFEVVNIEIAEEVRHEFKREVWTEEQRRAYREKMKQ